VSGFKSTNIAATTAAVANRLVTTANMKVGAYTLANTTAVWAGGFKVSVTHTTVTVTADTLGTIDFVGKDLHGNAVTETVTPVAGTAALGTKVFKSMTSITGVGWVIDAVEGTEDTIVIGVQAGSFAAVGGGLLHTLTINNVVAAAVTLSDASGTIATIPASQAAGTEYIYDLPWSGFLKIATTSTNDVTMIHSPGVPSSYAMS
jgi:hypothetical protein